jgi:hypothetical protein
VVCPNRQTNLPIESDILGRHEAVHAAREGRNEHPHRKRACYECARVRERCSRGEPCRRCKTKGLCCLYPEESRFKISMPDAWTPSTPGSDGYDAMTVEDTQPTLEALSSGRDMASQDYTSSQYEAEESPDLYRRSLLPSIFSNWDAYHCPPEYEDVSFLSSIDCDRQPSRKHGASRRSHKKSKYNHAESFRSNTDPERAPQYYGGAQTTPQQAMHYSDEAALRELDSYLASQDQRVGGLEHLLESSRRHVAPSPVQARRNSKGNSSIHARASAPKRPARYDGATTLTGGTGEAQALSDMSPDANTTTYPIPFRPSTSTSTATSTSSPSSSAEPHPRLVNIRDYEVIATRFKEFRNQSRFTSQLGNPATTTTASTTTTTPRTEQHDALLRLYFEYFSSHPDAGRGSGPGPGPHAADAEVGLEERFDGCLDNLFV